MAPEPSSEEPPERPRALLPAWAWIALAAVLLFSALTTFLTHRTARQIVQLNSELAEQRERSAALQAERRHFFLLTAILTSPETRKLTLAPAKPELPALGVYWNERLGFVLSAPGAPEPGTGFTYQFWIIPEQGDPVSVAVFSSVAGEREVHVFPVLAEYAGVQALAVTEEPAGGNPKPSTPPLWRADLKRPPIIQEPSTEPPGLW